MRKLELTARNIDEAKLLAYDKGITVMEDLTKAWRQAGSPLITKFLNRFVANYFQRKNLFDFEGAGIIIEISKATKDTRKKPWKFKDKDRHNKSHLTRVIEIRTRAEDKVIGQATRKPEAIKLAKELIMLHRESLYAKTSWSRTTFELDYLPDTKMCPGQYLVLGVDAADVLRNQVRIRDKENKEFI